MLGRCVEPAVNANDTAPCDASENVTAPTVALITPLDFDVSTDANAAPFSSELSRALNDFLDENTSLNACFTNVARSAVADCL